MWSGPIPRCGGKCSSGKYNPLIYHHNAIEIVKGNALSTGTVVIFI